MTTALAFLLLAAVLGPLVIVLASLDRLDDPNDVDWRDADEAAHLADFDGIVRRAGGDRG